MTDTRQCTHVDEAGRQCAALAGITRGYRAHLHWYRPTVAEFLAFEAENHPEHLKQSLIEQRWGMNRVRYYLLLNALLDSVAPLEVDPITTRRLLRQREERLARRASRTHRKAPQ